MKNPLMVFVRYRLHLLVLSVFILVGFMLIVLFKKLEFPQRDIFFLVFLGIVLSIVYSSRSIGYYFVMGSVERSILDLYEASGKYPPHFSQIQVEMENLHAADKNEVLSALNNLVVLNYLRFPKNGIWSRPWFLK